MVKLSEVMWVQAGFGKARRVMPFVLENEIIRSLSDDRLFQLDNSKSMFDNLYGICQESYGCSTVIMGVGPSTEVPYMDTTNKAEPTILNVKLPKVLNLFHKKEYEEHGDMFLNNAEVQMLSGYLTRRVVKEAEEAQEQECEF